MFADQEQSWAERKKESFFGGKGLIREFSLFMFNSLQTPEKNWTENKRKEFYLNATII